MTRKLTRRAKPVWIPRCSYETTPGFYDEVLGAGRAAPPALADAGGIADFDGTAGLRAALAAKAAG